MVSTLPENEAKTLVPLFVKVTVMSAEAGTGERHRTHGHDSKKAARHQAELLAGCGSSRDKARPQGGSAGSAHPSGRTGGWLMD